MENKNNELDIELSSEIAEGTYSNLAVISHSASEFVFDFIRVMPNMPKARVMNRVIMVPEHAKRLLLALQDNIRKYEQINGKINLGDQDISPMPNRGFGNINGLS